MYVAFCTYLVANCDKVMPTVDCALTEDAYDVNPCAPALVVPPVVSPPTENSAGDRRQRSVHTVTVKPGQQIVPYSVSHPTSTSLLLVQAVQEPRHAQRLSAEQVNQSAQRW